MVKSSTDMATQSAFDPETYVPETSMSKFKRKFQESPFMVFGLGGCICAVAYGAFMYRRRKFVSTSIYMMQLRVAAQGTVVGCLTIGMVYNLYHHYQRRRSRQLEGGEDKS
uniref:Putative induced by hypoxia n=1 Tax=Ornithodoros turicata TaxID=34597 RepID=A0A2R5L4V9_9ACAR